MYPGAAPQSSLMAIAVGLMAAVGGFLYGYDTGLINGLLQLGYVVGLFSSSGKGFTAPESAIITAVLLLGTFFGALLAPLLSDTVGRKWGIILATAVAFNIGTVIQVSATTVPLLCVGRAISGAGVGIISAVVPLYQAEASPKWVRGAVISTYQFAITWGLLVSSAVTQGTHLIPTSASYRVPIALQFAWLTILVAGMWLLPESPRFYVRKDKIREAAHALSVLRQIPIDDPGLIEELVEIKATHDYELSFGQASFRDCFRSAGGRHKQGLRMFTGIFIQALQQCLGINFIFYYGVMFFNGAHLSNLYLLSLITYAVNVVATVPGIFLVELLGRRRLLMGGAVGMAVCNLIIAVVGLTTNSLVGNKVMIGLVCVFIAFFAALWGPGTWVVVNEIYSLGVRGKAVAVTAATNWLVNFVFAYISPYLFDTGHQSAALGTNIFFIWGGCNCVGVVFVYFFVYETRGLRLEEVDEMYRTCSSAMTSSLFKPRPVLTYGVEYDDTAELKQVHSRAPTTTNTSTFHWGADAPKPTPSAETSFSPPEISTTLTPHFWGATNPSHFLAEAHSLAVRGEDNSWGTDGFSSPVVGGYSSSAETGGLANPTGDGPLDSSGEQGLQTSRVGSGGNRHHRFDIGNDMIVYAASRPPSCDELFETLVDSSDAEGVELSQGLGVEPNSLSQGSFNPALDPHLLGLSVLGFEPELFRSGPPPICFDNLSVESRDSTATNATP